MFGYIPLDEGGGCCGYDEFPYPAMKYKLLI
jgi:hypothetical protein